MRKLANDMNDQTHNENRKGILMADLTNSPQTEKTLTEHQALPVAGYRPQSAANVNLVNGNKQAEERSLQILDLLAAMDNVDKRWLAIGRTHLEQAWMAINRAIFKPDRVVLPPGGLPEKTNSA
jgi:hypothetical protein